MANTQVLLIEAKPGAPIACDMTGSGDTVEERFAEYGRLFAHALIDRQRTADAVVFTFARLVWNVRIEGSFAGFAAVCAAVSIMTAAFGLLSASVYGVTPWNPAVLASVAAALAVVCAAAAAVPAWRAARSSSLRTLV